MATGLSINLVSYPILPRNPDVWKLLEDTLAYGKADKFIIRTLPNFMQILGMYRSADQTIDQAANELKLKTSGLTAVTHSELVSLLS